MNYKELTMDERLNYLIDILNITRRYDKKGKATYKTRWGNKTEQGIKETIINILCINENEKEFKEQEVYFDELSNRYEDDDEE